jgi:heme exporter protein D
LQDAGVTHELIIALAVACCVVAAILLVVLAVLVRRAILSRGLGTFDCSLRAETIRQTSPWRHGIARYGEEHLDWFRVFGVRPIPAESLSRRRLVILGSRGAEPEETAEVLPDWVVVRCGYGGAIVELAMSEGAFTGLAAWLESAPPGQQPVGLG